MEVTTWSLVFPAPYTTSGSPVRAARSRSRRANPRSATPGDRGAGDAGIVPPIASGRETAGPAAATAEHLPDDDQWCSRRFRSVDPIVGRGRAQRSRVTD